MLKKKLLLFPQTYGPFKSPISKCIAGFILKRSSAIYSRDRESIETVKKLLGKRAVKKKVCFCPDVAFLLDKEIPEKISILPPIDHNKKIPLIGLNINGLLFNGGYTKDNMFRLKFEYKAFIYQLLHEILQTTKADVLLVPHNFGRPGNINNDKDVCNIVFDDLKNESKGRIHTVNRDYNQNEIKGIIGLSNFFIGSRMHSCIAALSQGIPTGGVAYSKKFSGVFNSIGLGDMVIDAREYDMKTSIEKILFLFTNLEIYMKRVKDQIKSAQLKIRATFRQILIENGL